MSSRPVSANGTRPEANYAVSTACCDAVNSLLCLQCAVQSRQSARQPKRDIDALLEHPRTNASTNSARLAMSRDKHAVHWRLANAHRAHELRRVH